MLLLKRLIGTEISGIKIDYVTNAAFTSQLNDLKSQHIADEVKKIDDKVNKNSSDILGFESRLKQKEDLRTELEREASFNRGSYHYNQQSYLKYEPRYFNFKKYGNSINVWKSSRIDSFSVNSDLNSIANSSFTKPQYVVNAGRLGVKFSGNFMKQAKVVYPHSSVISIYIVYELEKRTEHTPEFTTQNCLFGAVRITKDINTLRYGWKA